MENQILVVYPFEGRSNAGGPEGFISQLIRPFSIPGIAVTPPVSLRLKSRWKRLITQPDILLSPANLWQTLKNPPFLLNRTIFKESGMADAPVLWFMHHGFYPQFAPFIRPHQKVIYQPHCPELPWLEVTGSDPESASRRQTEEQAVRDLMERSSVLVLPNPGARTIYEPLIGTHLDVQYIQSGAAMPADVGEVPLDPQFTYLLYIGRRLPIKGFDIVVDAFSKAYAQRPDLRLVICGTGEPLRLPGVIDVGFTARIHDWIASVDCVVNANRQSYLDLSVMETLAIGTPLVMTATHGHEIFRQFSSPDLQCLTSTSVDELAQVFSETTRKNRSFQAGQAMPNHRLYLQEFSVPAYHGRLNAFAQSVPSLFN